MEIGACKVLSPTESRGFLDRFLINKSACSENIRVFRIGKTLKPIENSSEKLREATKMTYNKMVKSIPKENREKLSDRLIDTILKSKRVDKMPDRLAKNILSRWSQGPLTDDDSLAELLEASVLLEPEKTVESLKQKLQMVNLAKAVEQVSAKGG